MSITGDVDVDAHFLNFSRGFRIEGDSLRHMLEPHTDLSAGGGTITDASGVRNIDAVQVRRIHAIHVAADAVDPQLCGRDRPRYTILAESDDTLSILIFSGDDEPSPNAHDTQLCAIFNFSTS